MFIRVNGITLHVETAGQGEPLLLLHGFTGSAAGWSPFIARWNAHCRLIAVDIIGHGESDAPDDAARYSTEHAVDDLSALLDRLEVEKAHVLGYSMGGRLALSMAVLAPDRVKSLILESSSPGIRTAEERTKRIQSDEALADRIEREGVERFVSYWEDIPLFQTIKRLPLEVQLRIRKQRLRNRAIGLANSLRGMGTGVQNSWWDSIGDLRMPVQLITGAEDGKFSEIAERMQPLIPRSRFTCVADAGHMVHVEQADIFDTIVREFLSDQRRMV